MDYKDVEPKIISFLHKVKHKGVVKSYLFGSYAKGEALKESDIDLILVLRKYIKSPNNTIRELYKHWDYDIDLSIIPYEIKSFEKAKKDKLKDILKESIEIKI